MKLVFGPVIEKRILLGSAYAIFIAGVGIFKPLMALGMLIGVAAVPFIVALFLILMVVICKIGKVVAYLINDDDDDLAMQCLLGVVAIVIPLVLYILGSLVIRIFS